jgi:hypothetical protein
MRIVNRRSSVKSSTIMLGMLSGWDHSEYFYLLGGLGSAAKPPAQDANHHLGFFHFKQQA